MNTEKTNLMGNSDSRVGREIGNIRRPLLTYTSRVTAVFAFAVVAAW